jgi:multidrug efflux pump subunit AcrA (membrane-fusion protein)
VRHALRRNVLLALAALAVLAGIALPLDRDVPVPVQVITATPIGGAEGGAAGGASVTANGYVAARTRASDSAELPGRIADLRMSEGSTIRKGEIIATRENDDWRADLAEARAESEVAAREASRRMVTSTTNRASFSEIAFSFRVTPGLLLSGQVFAQVMGVVGALR